MFDTENKPVWFLPLAIFVLPGSCYVFAAVIPSYRSDFAMIGITLTGILFIMAVWRVLQPHQTATHVFRLSAAHMMAVPAVLVSYRFWYALAPQLSLVIGAALFVVYLIAWLIPFLAPSLSRYIYREFFWFPNPTLARIGIVVGCLAFGYSMHVGTNLSEYGNGSILFAAITLTLILVVGSFYISAQLQRQKQGKEPSPLEAG
jgi:hypothetical protein